MSLEDLENMVKEEEEEEEREKEREDPQAVMKKLQARAAQG